MTTQATTPQLTPPQSKGGAPAGNTNRTRHGLRGSGLPPGCHHIERATLYFRRQLEATVLDARGEVSLVDAAYINTAFRAERHAQLAQRWLRLESSTMTPGDRLNYSREVAKASEQRDKAIKELCLPKRPDADFWSTLHKPNGQDAKQ